MIIRPTAVHHRARTAAVALAESRAAEELREVTRHPGEKLPACPDGLKANSAANGPNATMPAEYSEKILVNHRAASDNTRVEEAIFPTPSHLLMSFRFAALSCAAAAALLSASLSAASAQTLAADYQLQNTFASSVGTIGPLTVVGDSTLVVFQSATVLGNTQQVLHINPNTTIGSVGGAGVQSQTFGSLSASNYSVVLLADFSISTSGVATKVFDFKNLSTDAGLYITTTGQLEFIDGSAVIQGFSPTPVVTGTYTQIVLTRNSATNVTTVYQGGVQAFQFTDTNGLAILGDTVGNSAVLTSFKDDGVGTLGSSNNESSNGDIARLRLYDGVLSLTDVQNIGTTIPEPSTWALFGVGALALVAALRRRAATA